MLLGEWRGGLGCLSHCLGPLGCVGWHRAGWPSRALVTPLPKPAMESERARDSRSLETETSCFQTHSVNSCLFTFMFSSFSCARKISHKQAEWHLNVTTCCPLDLKGKWEEGLVIPGLEVGVLCLSLAPECQQRELWLGLRCVCFTNTLAHLQTWSLLTLPSQKSLQMNRRPTCCSGSFNSASYQCLVAGLRKCYFSQSWGFCAYYWTGKSRHPKK